MGSYIRTRFIKIYQRNHGKTFPISISSISIKTIIYFKIVTKEVIKHVEKTIPVSISDKMREGHEKMYGIGRP
jgi:hypothetical protein